MPNENRALRTFGSGGSSHAFGSFGPGRAFGAGGALGTFGSGGAFGARRALGTFSSGGAGSVTHLVGAQFGQSVGLEVVHVPYPGAGPAVAAALANHVPAVFSSMPPVAPHITQGTLRALAVTGKERSPTLPDIPTMSEAGFPEVEGATWTAVVVPAGTPQGAPAFFHPIGETCLPIVPALPPMVATWRAHADFGAQPA